MAIINKGSKLYSIVHFKCPHCNEGDFFESHPYKLSKVGDTYDKCATCNRKYSREPGFYFGAMFVSYALGVAVFVTIWVASLVLFADATATQRVIAVMIGLVVLAPLMYALSKIIWANMFFKYKGVAKTEEELADEAEKAANSAPAASS